MRWKPGLVGDEKNRLLAAGKSADTLEQGQYFYDAGQETLFARLADDLPVSTLRVSPEEKPSLDYNCYAPAPRRPLSWEEVPGAATSVSRNLAALQKSTARELHGMQADPMYAGPEEADFHLQSSSPALGSGENLSRRGFDDDFEAKPRPKKAAWSMGAFEKTK